MGSWAFTMLPRELTDSRATREVQMAPLKKMPETASQKEGTAGSLGGTERGRFRGHEKRNSGGEDEDEAFHRFRSVV